MRIEYEPTHDILNIEFLPDVPIADSVELEGVIIDYAKDRRVVSVEILDAGKRTAKSPLEAIDFTVLRQS